MRSLFLVCCLVLAGLSQAGAGEPPSPDVEVAQRRFETGLLLYDQRRYQAAIVEFEAARQLYASPAFEFNIARCHERLGAWAAAADAYEAFLAAESGAKDAASLRERVRVLRSRVGTSPGAQTAPGPSTGVDPAPGPGTGVDLAPGPSTGVDLAPGVRPGVDLAPGLRTSAKAAPGLRTGAIVVGALAVVVGGVGAGLVGSVASEFPALRSRCMGQCQPGEWAGLEARARGGYAMLGVAGAAVVVDIVLWSLDARRRHATLGRPFALGAAALRVAD